MLVLALYFLCYIIFTILGSIEKLRFFYCFSLLSIVSLNQTLNNERAFEAVSRVRFSHGLVVVQTGNSIENTLVAAHTYDVWGKKVSDYGFEKYRCVHLI